MIRIVAITTNGTFKSKPMHEDSDEVDLLTKELQSINGKSNIWFYNNKDEMISVNTEQLVAVKLEKVKRFYFF